MANAKVSELPAVSSLTVADFFDIVQGGVNKKATLAQLIQALAIVDTGANLGSTNPVPLLGQTAYASDTDVLAIGDGSTAWNSLPKLRPSSDPVIKRSVSTQTGISGTITTITGLSGCDFTVGSVPWEVLLDVPWVSSSAPDHVAMLYLTNADGSTTYKQAPVNTGSGSQGQGMVRVVLDTPGAYSVRAAIQKSSGAGTVGQGASLAVLEATLTARPMS